jgi:hypothetical protein
VDGVESPLRPVVHEIEQGSFVGFLDELERVVGLNYKIDPNDLKACSGVPNGTPARTTKEIQ